MSKSQEIEALTEILSPRFEKLLMLVQPFMPLMGVNTELNFLLLQSVQFQVPVRHREQSGGGGV